MADRLARALCRARDGLLVPLAATAGAFVRQQAWKRNGFDRPSDYARERLDRTARWLQDHAMLEKAMEKHPSLRTALLGRDGKPALGQVAALTVARVATAETLDDWIARARAMSVRELLDEVKRFKAERRRRPVSAEAVAPADRSTNGMPLSAETASEESGSENEDGPIDLEHDDSEDGERCRVRIPAADYVVGVFDELRDLFAAVNGRDAGKTALIEACLGESASSGVLPIVIAPGAFPQLPEGMRITPIRVGPADAVGERALSQATGCWEKLKAWDAVELDARREPKEWEGEQLRQAAKDLLLRAIEVGLHAGQGGPRELHRQFEQMTEIEDEIERHLGQHLAYMSRRRAWQELGFTGVAHYAAERLGIRRSTAIKRSQLAAILRRHPKVRKAYRKGELGQEKSLLLHRVLVRGAISEEIEAAWVRWASYVTVKRIRKEVLRLERSKLDAVAGPPKISYWDLARKAAAEVVELRPTVCEGGGECEGEDYCQVEVEPDLFGRKAEMEEPSLLGVQLPPPEPLLPISDQAWIESLYRAPGMGLERLERWSSAYLRQHANEPLPRPTVFLDFRLPRGVADDLVNVIQAWHGKVTAAALWLDLEEPKKPFDDPRVLSMMAVKAAYLFTERSRRPPAWVGFLALLENAFRAWDDPHLHSRRTAEETYRKAGWQCMAPGCTAQADLENHHISFGPGERVNAPWNLICLCRFHHQQGIHGGLASVQGKAPLGLLFRIGRGELARYYVNEREVKVPGTDAIAS